MNQTVVGVFNTYEDAERAAAELARQGFDRSAMQIQSTASGGSSATTAQGGSTTEHSSEGTGVMASIRHFFAELFGDEEDHAGNYTEAVRRGGAVLTVEADESRLESARQALDSAGAVDIDERVSSWRGQGWSGHDADAAPYSREQATSERENVLPVVREELAVGKREVRAGAVRVVSRVVSRPVSESVELRREEAVVERRPVDREASQADLAAFEERTVEVQEMAERAVVQKTARVVEEVAVGKRVSSETQKVEDTVRSTEVNVERVGEGERADASRAATTGAQGEHDVGATRVVTSDAGGAQGGGGMAQSGAAATAQTSGAMVGAVSGAASSRRNFADVEDEFRQDYQRNFANSGASYDEIQPAYRGGYELRGDSRFADSDWNDVEPELRQRWESEHPGSAWERVKAAVRRGWDRATS
jgi:uncharacterized protein (TIGR02271 family)